MLTVVKRTTLLLVETLLREEPDFILIINLVDEINRVEPHAAGQMEVKPRNRQYVLCKMTLFCQQRT
jgi:hypothetical protein